MTPTTSNVKFGFLFFITILFSQNDLKAQSNCDILCPNDFTVIANEDGEYIVADYFENGTVGLDDECDSGAVISQSPSPGTVVGFGEFEVTMTVSFGGESDDCDFDISVVKQQSGDCDFDCPEDQIGGIDTNGNYIIPNYATNGALEITGDCGAFTFEQDPVAGTVVTEGSYSISLSATSEAGTSSISCSFNLTVDDVLNTDDIDSTTFEIYPNPSSTNIYFSQEVDAAALISITGTVVNRVRSANSMDVSAFPRGFYVLRLRKNAAILFKKIVLN